MQMVRLSLSLSRSLGSKSWPSRAGWSRARRPQLGPLKATITKQKVMSAGQRLVGQ